MTIQKQYWYCFQSIYYPSRFKTATQMNENLLITERLCISDNDIITRLDHRIVSYYFEVQWLKYCQSSNPLMTTFVCLFCLFVCFGFIVPLENVSLIWRRHHYRRRAANFDLWSELSSEGSLAFHTFCDTGHPFIMENGSPRIRNTHTYCRAFSSGACTTCLRLRYVAAEIRTPTAPPPRFTTYVQNISMEKM